MATIYYTASSLDGYIVDEHGSLDWLLSRDIDSDGPFSIDDFMAKVGSIVMGADTYEWIVKNEPGDWTYSQPSWVMTHRPDIIVDGHDVTTFAGDVAELHPTLMEAAHGKDVWVVGGGDVARQFVSAGLIDEMIVSYAPCTLGAGSPVLPMRSEWALVSSAVNADFVCAHWRRA
jgi:dihydrofolate reductase